MFGSSSTTSSRASACAPASVIDVVMMTIFARFAQGNLNVYFGAAVPSQRMPVVTATAHLLAAGYRRRKVHGDPERQRLNPPPPDIPAIAGQVKEARPSDARRQRSHPRSPAPAQACRK